MAWIPAVISAVGGATQAGVSIYNMVKGQKAKTKQIGVSGAQQAALDSQRYIADRLAMQGGLSAAQFQRAMQAPDAVVMQTQQQLNTLANTPFQDAFQREALSNVMISQMHRGRQETLRTIMDVDSERTAANASNAFQAQHSLAESERMAQAGRNAVIAANEQIQIDNMTNFAKSFSSVAQALGTSAEGIEKLVDYNKQQTALKRDRNIARSTGIAGGIGTDDSNIQNTTKALAGTTNSTAMNTGVFQSDAKNRIDNLYMNTDLLNKDLYPAINNPAERAKKAVEDNEKALGYLKLRG